jgi:hypothetical protein
MKKQRDDRAVRRQPLRAKDHTLLASAVNAAIPSASDSEELITTAGCCGEGLIWIDGSHAWIGLEWIGLD